MVSYVALFMIDNAGPDELHEQLNQLAVLTVANNSALVIPKYLSSVEDKYQKCWHGITHSSMKILKSNKKRVFSHGCFTFCLMI